MQANKQQLSEARKIREARVFSARRPPALERTAMYLHFEREGRKLMSSHPARYRTLAHASARARELDPDGKLREQEEEIQVAAECKKTRFIRRAGEREESDTTDKLRDGEREVTKGQRDRREAVTAFVDSHVDDVQRKVDREELDLESAVTDVILATLVKEFKGKIKRAKPKKKAASERAIRVSPKEFTDRVIKRMRSGSSGHDLAPSIAHTMESLAS